jgi:hypothetical protein
MNTQTKIAYAWLVLGIIFGVIGVIDIAAGSLGGILTLAIAALIMYTSVHNFGGLEALKWDIKKRIRLFGK